jgi:hypothetical protein
MKGCAMIYGLTYLGVIHTLISLVAVAALIAFVREGAINPGNTLGKCTSGPPC